MHADLTWQQACEIMEYQEHPTGSLVVQTAWALVGLIEADYPHVEPLRKGIQLIMDRQQENGEWLQEAIEGVFNKSCMISYPNYKFTFTVKALGMFARKFPDEKIQPRSTKENGNGKSEGKKHYTRQSMRNGSA